MTDLADGARVQPQRAHLPGGAVGQTRAAHALAVAGRRAQRHRDRHGSGRNLVAHVLPGHVDQGAAAADRADDRRRSHRPRVAILGRVRDHMRATPPRSSQAPRRPQPHRLKGWPNDGPGAFGRLPPRPPGGPATGGRRASPRLAASTGGLRREEVAALGECRRLLQPIEQQRGPTRPSRCSPRRPGPAPAAPSATTCSSSPGTPRPADAARRARQPGMMRIVERLRTPPPGGEPGRRDPAPDPPGDRAARRLAPAQRHVPHLDYRWFTDPATRLSIRPRTRPARPAHVAIRARVHGRPDGHAAGEIVDALLARARSSPKSGGCTRWTSPTTTSSSATGIRSWARWSCTAGGCGPRPGPGPAGLHGRARFGERGEASAPDPG